MKKQGWVLEGGVSTMKYFWAIYCIYCGNGALFFPEMVELRHRIRVASALAKLHPHGIVGLPYERKSVTGALHIR